VIIVETYSRPMTDAQSARSGEPPLQSVALDASVVLVNATLPALSVPRPPGFLTALANQADAIGREYARWSPASWQVDGAAASARTRRFADGWAAYSDAADGVYVAAVGTPGTDPAGLSLAVLGDGQAYHVDLGQPLHPRVMTASSAARAGGERPHPQRPDWHADQLRLMPG
jgi:hypothetical protein